MLRGFSPRLYQETILGTCALKNTLVVLPTGLGKTGVALLLAAQRLTNHPNGKVVMLAPTKPLAEQHLMTFKRHLDLGDGEVVLFTGEVSPARRQELWGSARLVFATPQGLENDVIGGKLGLESVCLLIFDEAHRATGDYSYVFVARQYQRKAEWPRILALTASPGSEVEKIEEVCKNLFIEAVEIRTEKDADVEPYVQEVDVVWQKVDLPEQFLRVKRLLELCIRERIEQLRKYGVKGPLMSKRELLGLQAQLHARMAQGEQDFDVFKCISLLAEVMKVHHALELLECQGTVPLVKYLEQIFVQAESTKVKAVKNLVQDVSFKSAFILSQKLREEKVEHPKVAGLVGFVEKEVARDAKMKMIVFTQFRDSAVRLEEELNRVAGVLAKVFVGQAKKGGTGLSQKKQVEMLDWFRDGLFNVLIATSVAEEGLDIPKVDTVVFYEPIPSAIRHIQRRGRTGRNEKGKVVIFMTKGTREEAYSWSAKNKEKQMVHVLESLRRDLKLKIEVQQPTLQNFDQGVKIFADYREKSSGVVKELVELGVETRLEMLGVADYVLSGRVGVELKLVDDFVASIIDGRLLEQAKELKRNFERPVVVLQGSADIFGVRGVHPNAIRGMLATVMVGFGIPLIQTRDEKDTAALLLAMARREQEEAGRRDFSPHADRKPVSMKEQQEYVVSSLPQVGLNLARELLRHFGSVQGVFAASEDELREVEGVGEKKARAIREVLGGKYG
ncbi:DEAD/DEAH box helicase [Candidatus Woesearchaeota archaeon]|nr:MAG: DEAD/DEAH box helicase [Candidatus Woesearchaeota archaeon]